MATIIASIGALSENISSASNTTPIRIGVGIHYLKVNVGQYILVAGVTGNTNANGHWRISAVDSGAQEVTLEGSNGNAAYTGGGTMSRQYTSVQLWIAATNGALGGNIKIGEMYDDDGLGFPVPNSGTQIVLTGATGSSATAYRELRSSAIASLNGTVHRSNPVNLGGARIVKTIGNPLGNAVEVSEDWARLTRLGIYVVDPNGITTGGPYYGVKVTSSNNWLDSVYCEYPFAAVDNNSVFEHTAGTDLLCTNCIAVGGTDLVGAKFGFKSARTADRFYNCVAYHCQYTGAAHGFDISGSGAFVKNCIGIENNNTGGSSSDFLIGSGVVFTHCIDSDNSSAFGLSCIQYETAFNAWVYAAYRDFRNKPSAKAIGQGNDLSTVFTADFAGVTRTAPWEIGAYEGVTQPSFTAPTVVINTVGSAGRQYATLDLWRAATAKHAVSLNTQYIAELYADSDFALGAVIQTIQGATTDLTRNRIIRAAVGQEWDPINQTGVKITGTAAEVLVLAEPYLRLERVGVFNTGAGADRECVRSTGPNTVIDAIYAESKASTGGAGCGIHLMTGENQRAINCILVGSGTGAAGMNFGVLCDAPNSLVANCDAWEVEGAGGVGVGVKINSATSRAYNCIATDCTTCFDSAASTLSDYNLSSDTTAPGSNSILSQSSANVYNGHTVGDFRLKTTSPALNKGLSLGLLYFSDDFAKAVRTAPWEMGAYDGFAYETPTAAQPVGQTFRECACVSIEQFDGTVDRFTDYCRAIPFRGHIYTPERGVTISARRRQAGLVDQNMEMTGAVGAAGVTVARLMARKYRDAKVTEYMVDWQMPFAEPRDINVYYVGDVEHDDVKWRAQLHGALAKLQQEQGRQMGRLCSAVVGDERCKVDVIPLSALAQTVTTVDNARYQFRASGISGGFADAYFRYGFVRWLSGNNAGELAEVKVYFQSTRQVELQEELFADIQVGDVFDIIVGCDRRHITCLLTFNNLANNRGHRFMTGTDRLIATPQA